MDSIGEVHFFLCPDKERNEPKKENRRPVLLGLAPILYGGQLETRFAQTIELLNPPPFISASPAGPAGLRMAGELNGILTFAVMKRGPMCGGCLCWHAHDGKRKDLG